MHPGMMHWWKARQRAHEYGTFAACGPGHGAGFKWGDRWSTAPDHGDLGAGAFGVRRPLRFLAYKLQLNDGQVEELARILNELKTERAQAEVDGRRAVAALADAVAGPAFDEQHALGGAALRVKSAEHLRDVVVKALGRIHALLEPEQRARLAYLIRTGTLVV